MFVALVSLFLFAGVQGETPPVVNTPLGPIIGTHRTSHDGRTFSAFEGIPYAKPPIGSLRFEEAQPMEPWIGVWNASFLSTCAQSSMIKPGESEGQEDCLHINVYVPREHLDPSESLEVIVHIPGGGFLYGSGHMYAHPEVLMDRDVVFVTFNYRLGILGFLSTEDGVVPGNNGLKDQVQALKWVQQNIASFGGNPKSVTITGLSAGGSSVHLHYLSPLSKGLFHKGLAQSGCALNPFTIQEKPLIRTKQLADAVGCPTHDTKLLVACLKQRTFQQILEKMPLFFTFLILPSVPFGPVVENGATKPFLDQDPYISLNDGKVYDVPLIVSNTIHEGTSPALFLAKTLDYVDDKWEELAPGFLEYNNTLAPSLWFSTAMKIKKAYFTDNRINLENLDKLVQLFTDRFFTVPAETSVRMQAKVTESPVYYMIFGYPGDNNPSMVVSHGFDSKFYFGSMLTPQPFTSNELKMKDLLVDMLVSFAKTGTPLLGDVEWKPTGDQQLTFLRVIGVESGEITLETVAQLTPRSFWDSLGFHEGENLITRPSE